MNKTYTQQELDIELLKNTNHGILGTLQRLEQKIDFNLQRLEQKIDFNFHWTLGLIFGLYAIGIGALISAIGKAYHIF